jgi:hypothetical protein
MTWVRSTVTVAKTVPQIHAGAGAVDQRLKHLGHAPAEREDEIPAAMCPPRICGRS